MLSEDQVPAAFRDVIDSEVEIYRKQRSIQVVNDIPDTNDIPITNPTHWLKIPDVICVFADMKGSTQLSAELDDSQLAGAYRLFTETIVRVFHEADAAYIDVKGDGAFALFNGDKPHRALASAVIVKTFINEVFVPKIKELGDFEIGSHLGIDARTLLVRKIGLKRHGDRTDRQNEVWAGKTVNMAAKLASLSEHNQLLVSERFYNQLRDERAIDSCGCPDGE